MNALLNETKTSVKVVGINGQISLGKENAGRQVLVEEREPGVWLVRTARVIPDNELWLHTPDAQASIQEGLRYFAQNEPRATDPHQIFGDMIDGHTQQRTAKRPARSQRTKLPA
ncbi:MAG: hypothetical protein HC858_09960 [Brachymonas sp.]|nr:hypothetical protein [Brachymonas sp.]NJS35312.1 hypothetical protein [Brachymonas sp.]